MEWERVCVCGGGGGGGRGVDFAVLASPPHRQGRDIDTACSETRFVIRRDIDRISKMKIPHLFKVAENRSEFVNSLHIMTSLMDGKLYLDVYLEYDIWFYFHYYPNRVKVSCYEYLSFEFYQQIMCSTRR